ncbi:MAG: TonB family protein [Draconibacterium sp.]|nr:TonB family protein [Draconibacterium sp.]
MNPKHLFIFLILIFYSQIISSQILTDDKLLKLEPHPTDDGKFIAKFYDKNSRKIKEHWEMWSSVDIINANNFNELIQAGKIAPHGKCYILHKNGKIMLEENYEFGIRKGDFSGFYETGEERYKGIYDKAITGKLLHLYKDGSVKKIEIFENGFKNGKTTNYDNTGKVSSEINYTNGAKDGQSIIFFSNGIKKRKLKYKMDNLISEKCYDNSGNKIDCSPLLIEPTFPGGFKLLKSEIEMINFDFNTESKDTSIFQIELIIDTIGNVQLYDYNFHQKDPLLNIINDWVNNLPTLKPMIFDGLPKKSIINIIFPIFQNKILWLGELTVNNKNTRDNITQSESETFFWEYPYPIASNLYIKVDKMPKYPGGEKALIEFISRSLKYPDFARINKIEGKVYVTFVVDTDGVPINVKIAKSVHSLLDMEAIRVVKSMPKWEPGSSQGKPVCVSYTVPINFVLRKPSLLQNTNSRF